MRSSSRCTSCPEIAARPSSNRISPHRDRNSDVLPAPSGPATATISCVPAVKLNRSTASPSVGLAEIVDFNRNHGILTETGIPILSSPCGLG